jgi:hypothetical protein
MRHLQGDSRKVAGCGTVEARKSKCGPVTYYVLWIDPDTSPSCRSSPRAESAGSAAAAVVILAAPIDLHRFVVTMLP